MRRQCLIFALLAVSGLWSPGAAGQQPAGKANVRDLDIRPIAHKAWGNNPKNVRAILDSAGQELWQYFPKRSLQPILVQAKGGPIVLFRRGASGEYRVQLNTGDNLWSQWVFQFAHEMGHILSNYNSVEHQNKWFEETVCEVASLFVLRRLAVTWSKDPAPGHWKRYAGSFRKYAGNRIRNAQLPAKMSLPVWYQENARRLARTGVDRAKNNIVAVQLLSLFEESPKHWEAIQYLAKAKKGHSESFPEYLKAWQGHCPEHHRPFVAAIARKFAIDLDKVELKK